MKKFIYFELNGLGEGIRYILHYTKQEFEDVRINYQDKEKWAKDLKAKFPFGQVPILEDGGKVLHQSLAIARYVAVNTHLMPSDPWDQALLDAVVLTIYDFQKYVHKFIVEKDPVLKEKYRKEVYEYALDFFFSRFEKQLKENNGFLGGKLSWADFIFVGIIECGNLFLKDNLEKNYPAIQELVKKVLSLPGVKEYVQKRKPYVV